MINAQPLNSIYGDDIPSDLQEALLVLEERLKQQQQYVKSVTLLPNCSIDYERTIHLQKTLSEEVKYVLQGLLVTVTPDYKLSYADAIWFHPEMGKGRSVYQLNADISRDNLKAIKEIHHIDGQYDKENPGSISPFHCDVGEYNEVKVDDMGLETEQKHLIVNASFEALTYPLWTQYLMTGETVGKVYENWTSMDMGNGKSITATSVFVRNHIAQHVLNTTVHAVTEALVYSDEVNALYSDGHSVYIANHALKTPKDDARVLVHQSALSGYELYSVKTDELFIPSNMGLSSKNFNWDDMSAAQRQRIFRDCMWEGNDAYNTYVLKPAGLLASKKKAFESKYSLFSSSKLRMKVAKFSSQPVRDFMEIGKLLKLTPLSSHMDGVISSAALETGNDISLKMSLKYKPFEQLLTNFEEITKEFPEFKLFNESLVDGNHIKIPREIINKLQ